MTESPPYQNRQPRHRLPVLGLWLAFCLTLAATTPRLAQAADPGCPDAELFSGKLITDICWACLFPVRIAGLPIGGGQVPAGAADSALCGCATGAGFTIGMWEPVRIIELTALPCGACLARMHKGRLRGWAGWFRHLYPTTPADLS